MIFMPQDDVGMCQKVRLLETLGFSTEEVIDMVRYPEHISFFQNVLFLADRLRMPCLSVPWKLHEQTGLVHSDLVFDELSDYSARQGKVERMEYIHNDDVRVRAHLSGLVSAIEEALAHRDHLSVEAVYSFFIDQGIGGIKELREYVERHGILPTQSVEAESMFQRAMERFDRLNLRPTSTQPLEGYS